MKTIITKNIENIKNASFSINNLSIKKRNTIIKEIGNSLIINKDLILKENKKDLKKIDKNCHNYDRLLLTEERIKSISESCTNLCKIKDPLNKFNKEKTIKTNDDLIIKKIGIPLGVIACIYEARPNVTIDLIVMSIKSGNAIILKGGKEAKNTNKILVNLVKKVLEKNKIDTDIIYNFPLNRQYLKYLYNGIGLIDVIIPRGGKKLIESVKKKSLIPIIETGAGVVHMYLDEDIDNIINQTIEVITNAKVSRPSVCNALDTLIINKNIKEENIRYILDTLKQNKINLIEIEQDYNKEHLNLNLNIKYVNNIDEAIKHIYKYSSKHSDGIISKNNKNINYFLNKVDTSVVYVNTSTRFSDGGCFGFGGEIGISTQKLHARGPMGTEALVTYKYIVKSDFKTR
ncbi:MAG: glutamate-5-semialdehyde dehydrogenase [Candidatus Gracilibacteria bacterium]|nr:glutamate-5-semialdehyde dehydrogenase [Candidatus Gracilibacteria bacterium]